MFTNHDIKHSGETEKNYQRRGGICTYIREQLKIVEIYDIVDPEIESQWFFLLKQIAFLVRLHRSR